MFPADTKPGCSRQPATTPGGGTESTCQRARRHPPCHRASGRPAITLGQFPQVHVPARSDLAGARYQPPARFAVEHERCQALAQTGLLTHLPRAAHPLNSPPGTDELCPECFHPHPRTGTLLATWSADLDPARAKRCRMKVPAEESASGPAGPCGCVHSFHTGVNPRNAADTKAPPHHVERATNAGAFR
jgi:hypothetical protein